jgi:hypothetical protein
MSRFAMTGVVVKRCCKSTLTSDTNDGISVIRHLEQLPATHDGDVLQEENVEYATLSPPTDVASEVPNLKFDDLKFKEKVLDQKMNIQLSRKFIERSTTTTRILVSESSFVPLPDPQDATFVHLMPVVAFEHLRN